MNIRAPINVDFPIHFPIFDEDLTHFSGGLATAAEGLGSAEGGEATDRPVACTGALSRLCRMVLEAHRAFTTSLGMLGSNRDDPLFTVFVGQIGTQMRNCRRKTNNINKKLPLSDLGTEK